VVLRKSDTSQDSLRRRIQRIETLLYGRQATAEKPRSISLAVAGIEKILGISPPVDTKSTILMPLVRESTSSPMTLPSPAGSQSSQLRTAFLSEANHKRWGAESAIGQSWSKAYPFRHKSNSRFQLWILDYKHYQIRLAFLGQTKHQSPSKSSGRSSLISPHPTMQSYCSRPIANLFVRSSISSIPYHYYHEHVLIVANSQGDDRNGVA